MVFCQLYRIYRSKWRLEGELRRYKRLQRTGEYRRPCSESFSFGYSVAFKRFFSPTQSLSSVYGATNRMMTYGFPENTILRSVLLYVALAVILFFVFAFNALKFPSDPAIIGLTCGCCGAITALLMAAYNFPACMVCVMLPTVITGTSRTIVILLALSWTIQGPMLNMQENLSHTTKTIACMQNLVGKQAMDLKTVGTKMMKSKLRPFLHLSDAFRDIGARTKEILKSVESGVNMLGRGLRNVNNWLSNIMITCNDELMKPYERCVEMFITAGKKCDESVWFIPFFMGFCRAVEGMKFMCKIGLILQKLCGFKGQLAEKIRSNMMNTLSRRIDQAEQELLTEYGFNFSMSQVVEYKIEYRSNVSELYKEISDQFQGVRDVLGIINTAFGYFALITCLQLPIGAALYVRRFLNSETVDNYFLTNAFNKFDRTLVQKGKEAAIPLVRKERKRFIPRCTLRATTSEILTRIFAPMINVVLSAMVICYWLLLDNAVYSFLYVVNSNLKETVAIGMQDKVTTIVSGEGLIARTYQNIMHEMTPEIEDPKSLIGYWTSCIYEPTPPDSFLRKLLVAMLFYAFASIILQMYLSRTKSLICELFYPERIKPRMMQLHTNILSGRGSWKQFAAKCVQKQVSGVKQDIGHELTKRMASKMQGLGGLLRAATGKIKHCWDCNDTAQYEDFENFRHCENFDCQAPYCVECYFRIPRCIKCRQIKQADDLEIDEEKPGLFLTEQQRQQKTKEARKRVMERRVIELYSA